MPNILKFFQIFISFFQYVLVGLLGSALAFFLALNFITPALSEEPVGLVQKTQKLVDKVNVQTAERQQEAKEIITPPRAKEPVQDIQNIDALQELPPERPAAEVPKDSTKPQQNIPDAKQNLESLDSLSEESKNSDSFMEEESFMTPFIYDSSANRRDPFKDPTAARISKVGKGAEVKTPPEQFDISDIEIKGIVWDTKKPRVLVQLPDTEFYTLSRGDKIGKFGIIFEVREDEVVILDRRSSQGDNLKSSSSPKFVLKAIKDRLEPSSSQGQGGEGKKNSERVQRITL